ncbi:MAG: sensor histidine kinase [Armatimonadota bacterium]
MNLAEQLKYATERLTAFEIENADLYAKANLLDTLIQRTPAAVAMFDVDMRYLAYSDRWLTDYHLGQQNLLGRSHYEVFPEISERWKAIHQQVLAGNAMSEKEDRFERADGSVDWVSWECVPWHTAGGNIGGIIMFTEVVTEQVQVRETLRKADRAKDQFLMVLSHELKTPLTSILGWAQAALQLPEQCPQALDVIVRNAKEQSRTLEDLLDVSRLVTGRFSLRVERTDLWELAHLTAERDLHSVQSHGLTLHEEPPGEPLPILADVVRLCQAIGNLLTNAIKFTEPGGDIWLRAFRQDQLAILEVQDNGRGINPEELTHLFRPFLQLHREEQKGGIGLGLSLVKGIVELHDGHVQAVSPGLGRGSTFIITLPLMHHPAANQQGC